MNKVTAFRLGVKIFSSMLMAGVTGILLNCLSEYCFAHKGKYSGMLIINYSDLEEKRLRKAIAGLEKIFLS